MKQSPVGVVLALLLFVAAAAGLSRLNFSTNGIGTYPEIYQFKAEPETINPGQSATLSWSARGAVSIIMESTPESAGPSATELKTGLPDTGSMKVQPKETTTYVIRCETAFSGLNCLPERVTLEVKK